MTNGTKIARSNSVRHNSISIQIEAATDEIKTTGRRARLRTSQLPGMRGNFIGLFDLAFIPPHHRSSISSHPNALTVTPSPLSTSTVVVSASMIAGPVRVWPGCRASSA